MNDWTSERRKKLKSGKIKGSFAGAPCDKPLSFPIAGPKDVLDAWRLSGHSCNPKKVRDNIRRIAKKYGWESALPNTATDTTHAVKSLGDGKFGSYAFLWGDNQRRDVAGEFFSPRTRGLLEIYNTIGKIPVVYHHTADPKIQGEVVGVVDNVKMDDIGLWVEGELRKSSRYKDAIQRMIASGGLYFSSGALPLSKKVSKNGHIDQWVWAELSLTPQPAEPRMVNVPVQLLAKTFENIGINAADTIKSIYSGYGVEETHPELEQESISAFNNKSHLLSTKSTGDNTVLEDIYKQRIKEAETMEEIGDLDAAVALRNQAEGIMEAAGMMQAEGGVTAIEGTTKAMQQPPDPNSPFATLMRPPMATYSQSQPNDQDDSDHAVTKAFYYNRIGGDEDAATKSVYKSIFGPGYVDAIVKQEQAFTKYVRFGERALNRDDESILNVQIFPSEHVKSLMKAGMETAAIKATMVEAQGTLGGFAVPPTVQRDILTRLPGFTVVRSGGANVIVLQSGNSIEVPEYTGGNDVYRGKLRGAWGSEASMPPKKDVSWGFKQLFANIYTYRMRLSRTMVEDAQNIVAFLTNEMAQVLALDEDREFLIGDGVGKPLGILPGGENSNGFKEINSGNASAITDDGVRKMKRALAKQYRNTARWIANSDTFGTIERLKDTTGRTLYPDLTGTEILLSKPTSETEFMPDIASGSYPLVFANLNAYWIVEKYGLTIERYQDSGTGINAVEFHVRRRVGGAPVEPWYFSVMKIAA